MSTLKQRSINAIIWNLAEKYGVQFVSMFIGIILARLLTPADYGLIGMVTVFFAIAMVFVNGGFGAAYIQKKDANETDASTIFFFNIALSLLSYLVLWFAAPFIANFFNQEALIDLVRVMAIVIIINSLSLIHVAKLTKEVDFKKKTLISLSSVVISGVVGISAALKGYEVWSLVFQQLTAAGLNTTGLWLFYNWRPSSFFSLVSFKKMFSFGSWILLSSLVRALFDNIYVLTIGKFFPVAELGLYTKAKSYQKLVSRQPSSAIALVSFPVFSKLQDDKNALKRSMKKFSQHTLFFIAPLSAVLFVIADPLVTFVLTEKWIKMTPYFRLLLISGLLFPINLLNVKILNALGRSDTSFKLEIIKNVLRVLNVIIMFRFSVLYIIIGEVIVTFLGLIINAHFVSKLVGYNFIGQLKDISRILLTFAVIVPLGTIIIGRLSNIYLEIVLGTIVVTSLFLISMFYFHNKMFNENVRIIKDLINKVKGNNI